MDTQQRTQETQTSEKQRENSSFKRHKELRHMERQISSNCKLHPISIAEYQKLIKKMQGEKELTDDFSIAGKFGKRSATTSTSTKSRHTKKAALETTFLNRVIKYFGNERSGLESDAAAVGLFVESFVAQMMQAVKTKDPRFDGKVVACGSYYEGVKVKEPNEFDYTYELLGSSIDAEELEIIHVKPDTFKPRKSKEINAKSYYKLRFKNKVPARWRCKACRRLDDCPHWKVIDPRQLQEAFKQCVQEVASGVSLRQQSAQVTVSGPAVTLYTTLDTDTAMDFLNSAGQKKLKRLRKKIDCFLIKIDLSLGIPILNPNPSHGWPLQGHNLELDADLVGSDTIPMCHLVIAGDFWRASFCSYETVIMHQIATKQTEIKECFQAIKYMRDELAITEEHEATILGTYPLKVTFMKENKEHPADNDWDFWQLSTRAYEILQGVEQGGIDGKLTSYFIKNDPILMESDRSYIESRRIRHYLEKLNMQYNLNGKIHCSLLSVIAFFYVIILGISAVFYQTFTDFNMPPPPPPDGACVIPKPPVRLETSEYIFVYLPLASLALFTSLVGLGLIVSYKCCLRRSNVLYEMYQGILYVYVALVCISSTLVGMACRLIAGYQGLFQCTSTVPLITNLTIATIAFTALPIAAILCHTVLFLTAARCHPKKYKWEWVFFDKIYGEFFGSCRCSCVSGTPPPLPPRNHKEAAVIEETEIRIDVPNGHTRQYLQNTDPGNARRQFNRHSYVEFPKTPTVEIPTVFNQTPPSTLPNKEFQPNTVPPLFLDQHTASVPVIPRDLTALDVPAPRAPPVPPRNPPSLSSGTLDSKDSGVDNPIYSFD